MANKCKECEKKFDNLHGLRVHVAMVHSKNKLNEDIQRVAKAGKAKIKYSKDEEIDIADEEIQTLREMIKKLKRIILTLMEDY